MSVLKKISIFLFVTIVVYAAIVIFYYQDSEDSKFVTEMSNPIAHNQLDVIFNKDNSISVDSVKKIKGSNHNILSQEAINFDEKLFDDKFKKAKSANSNIIFESIDDGNYTNSEKEEFLKSVKNLKYKGSMSGGLVTTEFSNLSHYRDILQQNGADKILSKISFREADLGLKGFTLTGADVSGRYSEKTDKFDGLYRLYENSYGGKIEINEVNLLESDSVMAIKKETINYEVMGFPATFETLQGENIYNIRIAADNKYYFISGMYLPKDDFLKIADNLIKTNNRTK